MPRFSGQWSRYGNATELCKTNATKRNKTTQQNAKRKKLYKIKTKEMELMNIKINKERRKFLQIIGW
jgi:hypothetical protein